MQLPHVDTVQLPHVDTVSSRWLDRAAQRAGIDMDSWKPELGTIHNRDFVRRSYAYYGAIYLANPHMQWMGLANMISPTFGAAFDDLAVINAALAGEPAPPWLAHDSGIAAPHLNALEGAVLSGLIPSRADLRNLEHSLLSMQRKIFVDQAIMHEAFLADGMRGIEELRAVGAIDDHALNAWKLVDQGRRLRNQELIDAGAEGLLWREQMQVIADDYDQLREGGGGRLIAFALSLVGKPSIPGAKGAVKFSPIKVGPIRLPLPGIDISDRHERWAMASGDTVPAFERLLRTDPDRLRTMVAKDTDTRIREERLSRLIR